jgi:glycosyltransferase involved in cell wall biosynthesis
MHDINGEFVREQSPQSGFPPVLPRPFETLRSPSGGPLKVAILSDFVRIPYANGAVFQTRNLYRSLRECGHEVTVIGPCDPEAHPSELAPGTIQVPSRAMRAYPGLYLPLPLDPSLFDASRWDFDIVFAQTCSPLAEFGVWLRKMKGIPLLCVNTTHLPAAYEVLLPSWLSSVPGFRETIEYCLSGPFEQLYCNIYNESDGLVVLSDGLKQYWIERGVRVPVHVIPRAISSDRFDSAGRSDPYLPHLAAAGLDAKVKRLVCAGRLTREKAQDRAIRIFAEHVLPKAPDTVLFMVGTGPDSAYFKQVASSLGVQNRVLFLGEVPFAEMPSFYEHGDLFVHTSLSETFGNVLGEALWSGMAVVAMADGMGASSQITHRLNGYLLPPDAPNLKEADRRFGEAVVSLLSDSLTRRRLGREAARVARLRSAPLVIEQKMADAFEAARNHVESTITVPGIQRSRLLQLATTAKHAQRWALVMSGLLLSGRLRRAPERVETRASIHASFAT